MPRNPKSGEPRHAGEAAETAFQQSDVQQLHPQLLTLQAALVDERAAVPTLQQQCAPLPGELAGTGPHLSAAATTNEAEAEQLGATGSVLAETCQHRCSAFDRQRADGEIVGGWCGTRGDPAAS